MTIHPRMLKAVSTLIVAQPFYGTLTLHLNIVEASDVETMAVDGKSLFYNPEFLATLDDDEALFTVAHEDGHVANLHHTRRGDRDPVEWNICCDFQVNGDLIQAGIGRMPKGGLYDPQYLGLSAEDIYALREAAKRQGQPQQSPQQPDQGESEAEAGEGDAGGEQPDQSSEGEQPSDEAGDEAGGSGSDDGEGDQSGDAGSEADAGDDAGEGEGEAPGGTKPGSADPGRCGAVLDAGSDAGEIAEQEAEWQTVIRQAINVASRAGNLPAHLERVVENLKKPQHDWREILRRFVDPSSRYDFSWSVPDRRFGGQPFVLPGTVTDGVNHIAAIVDTSGSIDLGALQRFGAELQHMADEGVIDKLTVVYCDCAVQRTAEFDRSEPIVFDPPQGGGTAFAPALDWIAENEPDISAALYFTDLDGGFGAEPAFPLLWAVYGDPRIRRGIEPPFGEVLEIAA